MLKNIDIIKIIRRLEIYHNAKLLQIQKTNVSFHT